MSAVSLKYALSASSRSIGDVSKTLLDQVEEFFVSYNKQRGRNLKLPELVGQRRL